MRGRSPTLNNQLSTCSQQLGAISSVRENSYLKVNQPVTGEDCACGLVPICPSVCPTPLGLPKSIYTKQATWVLGFRFCYHTWVYDAIFSRVKKQAIGSPNFHTIKLLRQVINNIAVVQ